MRTFLLVIIIAFGISSKSQEINVLHYRFDIALTDKNDSIKGETAIKFVRQNKSSFASFDLVGVNNYGKGMKVSKATIRYPVETQISFNQKDNKIIVELPSKTSSDTLTVYITYAGIPADGLIISKNKYGDRTFFADNWPDRAHHWIPCVDRLDDKASFEFLIEAPHQYSAVSNGFLTYEKSDFSRVEGLLSEGRMLWHWKEDIPSSTKVMVIGVAKFASKTFEDSPPNIPVSAWVYPQDSTKGFYDYGVAPGILKFFADYIGPFPYKKLANVQSKTIFGGMENASCIFYNEDYVTGDRQHEDVIAHEIAHQWFGDAVTEKSFAHLWLSEGFANYFENYYFEKKYGEEAARKKWEAAREEVIAFSKQSDHPVVDSTKDLMSLLNTNSYQKGAWVLRMLRLEVGDSVFQKIVQTYYQQYKHRNAETRDFEKIAEQVSGKELTWFIDQWLYQSQLPTLYIKKTRHRKPWIADSPTEIIEFKVIQMQQKPFRFPLTISYKDGNNVVKYVTKYITEKETEWILSDRGRINQLKFDPNATLLMGDMISEGLYFK